MTDQEANILRYLNLLGRRMYIILHSGTGWKPEYGPELQQIDEELLRLRATLGMKPLEKS